MVLRRRGASVCEALAGKEQRNDRRHEYDKGSRRRGRGDRLFLIARAAAAGV